MYWQEPSVSFSIETSPLRTVAKMSDYYAPDELNQVGAFGVVQRQCGARKENTSSDRAGDEASSRHDIPTRINSVVQA